MKSQSKSNFPPVRIALRSVESLRENDSPVITERLHPDVSEAIWAGVSDAPSRSEFKLEFEVPEAELEREEEVRSRVATHFELQGKEADRELRAVYRKGLRELFVGLIGVIVIIALAEALSTYGAGRPLLRFMGQSLVIVAWVILWIPTELLVFQPVQIRFRRRKAASLASAKVRLTAGRGEKSG